MATLEIRGWREGFRKIACTHLLRDRAHLTLAEAKACTDRVLEGQLVTLSLPDSEIALRLAQELYELGADETVTDPEADV